MNFMEIKSILFYILFCIGDLQSQSSINSGGNTVTSQNMSLSYSIGQTFFENKDRNILQIYEGVQVVFLETSEINYKEENQDYNFFPNPVNNSFIIELTKKYENFKCMIYDQLGKKVYESLFYAQKNTIDVNHLTKGNYNVILSKESEKPITFHFKIFKR